MFIVIYYGYIGYMAKFKTYKCLKHLKHVFYFVFLIKFFKCRYVLHSYVFKSTNKKLNQFVIFAYYISFETKH